jgi:hypothetical protein
MSIMTTIEQQPTTACISNNEKKKSRKRGRRVSFSESLEQVQVVENLRLTLTPIEKAMVWDVEESSDFFAEEKSAEQVLFEAFVSTPSSSSSSPKKNKNSDKKKRRKSRSQSISIFGDFNQAPGTPRAQKIERSSTKKLLPLNSIRSRLGIRTGGKKSVTPLPLRD